MPLAHRLPTRSIAIAAAFAALVTTSTAFGFDRPDIKWMIGGHANNVAAIAFSPDDSLVASASWDGTVKVWSMADGRLVTTLAPPFGSQFTFLSSVRFSADGDRVLACGLGAAFEWTLADGMLWRMYGAMESGSDAAYSPDGQSVVVTGTAAGTDVLIELYDADSGLLLDKFDPTLQPDIPLSVQFTPDGHFVAAGGGERIRVLSAGDFADVRDILYVPGEINEIDISPDGQWIASASGDDSVTIWDFFTGTAHLGYFGHAGDVASVAFSPDGTQVASAGMDGTVQRWDPLTGALNGAIPTGGVGLESVAWSNDGTMLASGARAGTFLDTSADASAVQLWRASDGEHLRTFTQFSAPTTSLALSADERLLAVGESTGKVRVLRVSDGALVREWEIGGLLYSMVMSPDGSLIATSGGFGPLQLWRTSDGGLVQTISGLGTIVWTAAFSPDGQQITVVSTGGLHTFRVSDGGFVHHIPAETSVVGYTPDGAHILFSSVFSVAMVRNDTQQFVRNFSANDNDQYVSGFAVSPDGAMVAVVFTSRVEVFRIADSVRVHSFPLVNTLVRTVSFTADSRVLLGGGGGDFLPAILAWRMSDGEQLAEFTGEAGIGPRQLVALPRSPRFACIRNDACLLLARAPLATCASDVTADGLVDLADFLAVGTCWTGPDGAAQPGCHAGALSSADADADGDLDLSDFAAMQRTMLHACP